MKTSGEGGGGGTISAPGGEVKALPVEKPIITTKFTKFHQEKSDHTAFAVHEINHEDSRRFTKEEVGPQVCPACEAVFARSAAGVGNGGRAMHGRAGAQTRKARNSGPLASALPLSCARRARRAKTASYAGGSGGLLVLMVVFLAAWLAGLVASTYAPYRPVREMFPSFVALLDIILVFIVLKGDVRLT